MDDRSVFQIMSDVLREEKVIGILVGGFAVNFHLVQRQTSDIDFLVAVDDLNKMTVALGKAGFFPYDETENFVRFAKQRSTMMGIDLILVERDTLLKVKSQATEKLLAKWKFLVPCLEHLIAFKLHAIKNNPEYRMYKDLPDIINLVRQNKMDVHSPDFKKLCLKFGTKSIYEKLLEALPCQN